MIASTTAPLERGGLLDRYRRNRERSARLFGLISDEAYAARPIALRHPFVFYQGHIPAFSFITLNERALGEAPLDSEMERLFERGIDPGSLDDARRHSRESWPRREVVERFGEACDERVIAALRTAKLVDPDVPRLVRGESVFNILEHEAMHHETLLYIVHELSYAQKVRVDQEHHDHPIVPNVMRAIDAGIATLGAGRDEIPFGWDNEFERSELHVPSFSIQQFPVTNADWLAFVSDGGPVPHFWIERDGAFLLRGLFEELPLPMSWPVYVSHAQADAYARWAGMRLPTEPQYHRAAYGSPGGIERPYPWGHDAPAAVHGNFDFARFDPEPVDEHDAGASAFGVYDLVGNGWEWTSTPFGPLPGFAPMASYPPYSSDFFDGKHYVMKGASPVTAREMVRRSFRNWFYADYPYMFAKFRCVL